MAHGMRKVKTSSCGPPLPPRPLCSCTLYAHPGNTYCGWHGDAFLFLFESREVLPGEATAFLLCANPCSWKPAFPCGLLSGYSGSGRMSFSSGENELPEECMALFLVQEEIVLPNAMSRSRVAPLLFSYYSNLRIHKGEPMETLHRNEHINSNEKK